MREYDILKYILSKNSIDWLNTRVNKSDYLDEYLVFPIKKKSGKLRWITSPTENLKRAQYDILNNLVYLCQPHFSAVGFIKDKSVINGAEAHLGSKALVTVDIKDFFPSIKKNRVKYALYVCLITLYKELKLDIDRKQMARVIEVLTPLVTYKGGLPQGAPTSPAISNIAFYYMDNNLYQRAYRWKGVYTRYADDITMSFKDPSLDLQNAIRVIKRELRPYDLKINPGKTRMQRRHVRMSVTGIVINDKLSVPKWKWKNFRAKLHNLEKSQKLLTKKEYQQIQGYANWLNQLDPKKGKKYVDQLKRLNYEQ